MLVDFHALHWEPNIEIATRERLLERGFQTRGLRQPPRQVTAIPSAFRSPCLEERGTYHLEGMVETLMFEGLQRNMGEVRAAARVHDDTSAAGPRPERPPLAQRQAILAVFWC